MLRVESVAPFMEQRVNDTQFTSTTSEQRTVKKAADLASELRIVMTALGRLVEAGDQLSQVRMALTSKL
jgi:hypothetical protein